MSLTQLALHRFKETPANCCECLKMTSDNCETLQRNQINISATTGL